jgi:hypothetical protein
VFHAHPGQLWLREWLASKDLLSAFVEGEHQDPIPTPEGSAQPDEAVGHWG